MGAPGFDDAPTEVLPIGAPKCVTLIYPYYENPNFLRVQLDRWRGLPAELRPFLRAIVVDDGSPVSPAETVLQGAAQPFPIRLFRIDVDVRWNWLAARNIGAHHAHVSGGSWLLLTDMDHIVPPETAAAAIHCKHDDRTIYRFSRREFDGRPIHPHPNSMLMHSLMYWRVGGYDEALSGHYGTDGEYRRRCASVAKVRTLSEQLERHEHFGDSSTVKYLRKQPEDAAVKKLIAARRAGWKPKVLSFPYREVAL